MGTVAIVLSENMIDQKLRNFDIKHVKYFALILVAGCLLNQLRIRSEIGVDSCDWLMTSGHFHGNHVWQPTGCLQHIYSAKEARQCFRNTDQLDRITFMGDSRVRYQYQTLRVLLSGDEELAKDWKENKPHNNFYYGDADLGLQLNFIWNERINDTMFDVFKTWTNDNKPDQATDSNAIPPTMVVVGGLAWSIMYMLQEKNPNMLKSYSENVTKLLPYIDKLQQTKFVWMLQEDVIEKPTRNITNRHVDTFNRALDDIFENTPVTIWKSARKISLGYENWTVDGLHLSPEVLQQDVQVFLNYYCNKHVSHKDGTCCKSTDPISATQWGVASMFVISIAIYAVLLFRNQINRKPHHQASDHSSDKSKDAINADYRNEPAAYSFFLCMARLAIIIFHIWLCDRTNFAMRENILNNHTQFYGGLFMIFTMGMLFSRESKEKGVLNKDQINEWKGVIILLILIYHMSKPNKEEGEDIHFRILMSMYLFISGFESSWFYFYKADFSCKHFALLLFRSNFLVYLLCMTMNQPYQFYRLVPMLSFWFCVVYIVMALPPRVSVESTVDGKGGYFILLLKLCFVVMSIALFNHSYVLFRYVFSSWSFNYLTTLDNDVEVWHNRWMIDRFSFVSGATLSILLHAVRTRVSDNGEENSSDDLFSRFLYASRFLAFIIIPIVLFGYMYIVATCSTAIICGFYPYISIMVILTFIMLRNSTIWLRERHNYAFAWLGTISLELYCAHYHIWLAADGYGVLVLLPGFPMINAVVTSLVVVCCAHEIHAISNNVLNHVNPTGLMA